MPRTREQNRAHARQWRRNRYHDGWRFFTLMIPMEIRAYIGRAAAPQRRSRQSLLLELVHEGLRVTTERRAGQGEKTASSTRSIKNSPGNGLTRPEWLPPKTAK